jgi:AcrR family transcriptional regulator
VIVEAGARVLGAGGWAAFTTNRVAEVAGVSIGSLYQYFPDKMALIAAIRERHMQDCLRVLRDVLASNLEGAALARHLVGGLIAIHDTAPGLHRVLLEEVPQGPGLRLADENPDERDYMLQFARILVRLKQGTKRADAGPDAQMVSDAVDGVIHNATRRGQLHEPALQAGLEALVLAAAG